MPADNASQPLVSVIALCYNHARFAIDCLESIFAQTYRKTELIIMDDASTDSSVQVIRDWISSRGLKCTFIAHSHNVGVCGTLNEALSRATGKYISMVSTDDSWEPDKLERQVPMMETAPEDVGVLYSDAWRMNEDGVRIPGMFIESYGHFSTMPTGDIFPILFDGNFIPAMTTLVRRTCYATVGLYDERLSYEDWDMWLRIAHVYKYLFSTRVSATYRLVSTSLVKSLLEPNNARALYSHFLVFAKCLAPLKPDQVRYRVAIDRVARFAEDLYRLHHPERLRSLRIVLGHASVLRKTARLRLYLLCAFSHLRLPYPAFCWLDKWTTRLLVRAK